MSGLIRRWMLVWASLLVFACGGGEDDPEPQQPGSVRIVSFDVTPREVSAGEEVMVRWEARHAEGVELLANGASVDLGERAPAAGEIAVVVSEATSFQLVARGRGGPVRSDAIVVTLRPADALAILSFTAHPAEVEQGEAATLSWVTQEATAVRIVGPGGAEVDLGGQNPLEGSVEVRPEATSTYTLHAERGDETVERSVTVSVLSGALPAIGEFWADPAAATFPSGTVRLHWRGVERADTLSLVGSSIGPIDLMGKDLVEDWVDVAISEATTFTLTARNTEGEVEAQAAATLVPLPSIVSLHASAPTVGQGETVTITWEVEDAARVELHVNGERIEQVSETSFLGSLDMELTTASEFVLRAFNAAGDSVEESVAVGVGLPVIASFTVEPSLTGAEQPLTFRWEVEAATALSLRLGGEEIHATTDAAAIARGSFEILSPPAEGEFVYELVATDGAGQEVRAEASVVVQVGPRIASFSANPLEVDRGDMVMFAWSIVEDPLGLPIELSLTDGTTAIDLEGADPLGDSRPVVMTEIGVRRFTLAATTASGSHAVEVDVTVHGVPAVTLTANPPTFDGDVPVTLQWTSAHADGSLALYALDEQGAPISPALHEVPVGERASGSFEVGPARSTTYRMVATNPRGSTATAEVLVEVEPPEILSFVANPQVVSAGEEVTLTWTTTRATQVSLDVAEGMAPFTEIADSFVDISQTGTPLPLTTACASYGSGHWDAHDEGCATISFPSGFTVPLFGEDQDRVRVYANGVMGFDDGDTSITRDNYAFPATQYGAVHLAPFWDNLIGVEVWYEFGTDASGSYLLVQWSGEIALAADFFAESSVNFQVLLREDGTVEYRYGEMSGEDFLLDFQEMADGASATIGYQSPSLAEFENLHAGGEESDWLAPMSGGLGNRSWMFSGPPALAPNGSYTFRPTQTMDVTLTAYGEGEVSETIQIVVNP